MHNMILYSAQLQMCSICVCNCGTVYRTKTAVFPNTYSQSVHMIVWIMYLSIDTGNTSPFTDIELSIAGPIHCINKWLFSVNFSYPMDMICLGLESPVFVERYTCSCTLIFPANCPFIDLTCTLAWYWLCALCYVSVHSIRGAGVRGGGDEHPLSRHLHPRHGRRAAESRSQQPARRLTSLSNRRRRAPYRDTCWFHHRININTVIWSIDSSNSVICYRFVPSRSAIYVLSLNGRRWLTGMCLF